MTRTALAEIGRHGEVVGVVQLGRLLHEVLPFLNLGLCGSLQLVKCHAHLLLLVVGQTLELLKEVGQYSLAAQETDTELLHAGGTVFKVLYTCSLNLFNILCYLAFHNIYVLVIFLFSPSES